MLVGDCEISSKTCFVFFLRTMFFSREKNPQGLIFPEKCCIMEAGEIILGEEAC